MTKDKTNNFNPESIFLPCDVWKSKMSQGEDVQGAGIFKTFIPDEVKVFDGEDGLPRAKFTISTGARDRDADTISPQGWELDNYKKNPVVLFAHDSRSLPIGQSVEIAKGNSLVATARFDTDIAEFALPRTVVALLKRGTLRATSVGFIPMAWQDADPNTVKDHQKPLLPIDFTHQELVEFSIVPVPSNPEALMQARAAGIDIAPVVNWAGEVLDMYGGAAAKGLWVPRNVLEKVARIGSPAIFRAPNGGWTLEASKTIKEKSKDKVSILRAASKQLSAASPDMTTSANLLEIIESAVEIIDAAAEELETELGISDDIVPDDDDMLEAASASGLATKTVEKSKDPIRWNPKLSKAFDVEKETFTPGTEELALVSKYIGCPVKRMQQSAFFVPSARMGSFLSALDEVLESDCAVEDIRNLDRHNKEYPPIYDTIQLNSKLSGEFLIDGIRFLDHKGAGKSVMHVEPSWYGLHITTYVQSAQKSLMSGLVKKTRTRAKELNFLKGEAFSLSGEFIERDPSMNFSELFLPQKHEDTLKQLVQRINDKGARMDNRGAVALGPPGTGKTLSGKILLNQAKATFIWLSARDFYYSGAFGGLAYAFEVARECSPSILFIEDVDNFLTSQTTDLMKTEMDGIVRTKGITTIITTNYPERFPKALIDRPGRFHDVLDFYLPDETVRRRMLNAWLPKEDRTGIKEAAIDKSIDKAVAATEGYSGAHVRELASYVSVLKEQDNLELPEAIDKAITKIAENREAINAACGQAYTPRKDFSELVAKTAVEVTKSKDLWASLSDPPALVTKSCGHEREANSKEALMAFDRMKQIEQKESRTRFIEVDGRAKEEVGEIKDNDAGIWCVVLRDHECRSAVVYNLGSDIDRSSVVQFATNIVEERKDPLLEVCPARSVGDTDEGYTVYEEFLRLHWKDTVKGENKNPNPAVVTDAGSVAGTMDIVEAIKIYLGPSLKKALAEATGRIVEDEE